MHDSKYHRKRQRIIAIFICGMMMIVIKCFIGFNIMPSIPLLLLQVFLDPVFWFCLLICVDYLTCGRKERKNERDFFKTAR
jgi:hypothetical protein